MIGLSPRLGRFSPQALVKLNSHLFIRDAFDARAARTPDWSLNLFGGSFVKAPYDMTDYNEGPRKIDWLNCDLFETSLLAERKSTGKEPC